ncbi:MAG: bifunctional diaminohydroxyphosphoribosylaminopyrimidine deaminase/5-amino-6-(5-phosphoribosylamino)uracil reductase, partial [Rivularia sp. (in: cyanobacteria)]
MNNSPANPSADKLISNTHKEKEAEFELQSPVKAVGSEFDRAMMRRCLELARRALGLTSPNPMVGAVIVKDGKIIGEGFHPKAGEPHAEVFALKAAGDNARG